MKKNLKTNTLQCLQSCRTYIFYLVVLQNSLQYILVTFYLLTIGHLRPISVQYMSLNPITCCKRWLASNSGMCFTGERLCLPLRDEDIRGTQ